MSWLSTVISVQPATEPVSLDDARLQCRVDGNAYDGELTLYIKSARSHVEGISGTKLITQTVVMRCTEFDDLVKLPTAPIQSISSIGYVDGAGNAQTLDASVYQGHLYGLDPAILLKANQSWPSIQERSLITVTATAGYGAASDVPAVVLDAVRMSIAQRFRGRELLDPDFVATLMLLLTDHRIW